MKASRQRTFLVAAAASASLLIASMALMADVASADEPDATAATTIEVLTTRRGDDGVLVEVPARLTDAEGQPLGNLPVYFFESSTDFFGERPVELGSATTDATGTALLYYVPASEGVHEITAQFYGNATYKPAESVSSIDVEGSVLLYEPEPTELQTISDLAPLGAVAVAALVWAALGVVLIVVVGGIRRAGRVT